ncbi:MAG: hypothetical protein Q8T08_02620 [Ignavibacteria bacterium]|nr:hypothetical protein [Ignavibacteria bacterium]
MQEACYVLGTQCLTLPWSTELPVTLKEHGGGTEPVGNNVERIRYEFLISLEDGRVQQRPDLWDGKAAERFVKDFLKR